MGFVEDYGRARPLRSRERVGVRGLLAGGIKIAPQAALPITPVLTSAKFGLLSRKGRGDESRTTLENLVKPHVVKIHRLTIDSHDRRRDPVRKFTRFDDTMHE